MRYDTLAGAIASWSLTYLLHGVLFAGLAWALSRMRVSYTVKDLGWKLALVVPILSATFELTDGSPVRLRAFQVEAAPPVRIWARRPLRAPARRIDWTAVALAAAGLVAAGRLAALGMRVARLRQRLADRREVVDPELLAVVDELQERIGPDRPVLLTRSARAGTPMALGRSEICLPEAALEGGLSPAALRGVLAHELAHLVREDNLWLAGTAVIEAVLFFQPLTRLVSRGLRETSEYLCDDAAVAATGDALGLARSLATVAGWRGDWSVQPLAHPAVGGEGSLVGRVRRLVGGPGPEPARAPGWLLVAGAGALALLAPVVSIGCSTQASAATEAAPKVRTIARARRVRMPARVVAEVVPRALETAGAITRLAMERAAIEEQLDDDDDFTPEQREEMQRQMDRLQAEINDHQQTLDREMSAWGEGFGREMEAWAQGFAREMDDWGRSFGKSMERWGKERRPR